MDKFSFLNSAHTSLFAEMYDQYLQSPDTLEPSWKAFFQGFDFGMESANITVEERKFEVPENITSSIPEPLILFAEVSPIHHLSDSTMFDFPQPLGPTIPVSPSSIRKLVFSAKDLNPFSWIFLNSIN